MSYGDKLLLLSFFETKSVHKSQKHDHSISHQINNMNLRSKTTKKNIQENYSEASMLNTHKRSASNREF